MNSNRIREFIITTSEINKLRTVYQKLNSRINNLVNNKTSETKVLENDEIEAISVENSRVREGEQPEDENSLRSITRRTTRLFLLVYILTNGYENILIGILRKKKLSKFFKDLSSISALRLAAFISSYSTLYRFLFHQLSLRLPSKSSPARSTTKSKPFLTSKVRKMSSSPHLIPFLAGSISSITMLLESSGSRRVTFAIYALTRSIESSFELGVLKQIVPKFLRKNQFYFGGHILFAISNAILLHAFLFDPETFPTSYSNFILKYSNAYLPSLPSDYPKSTPFPTHREIVDAIANSAKSNYPNFISPLLQPNSNSTSTSNNLNSISSKILPILELSHPNHSKLVCAFMHPNQVSCANVLKGFLRESFVLAIKFFGVIGLLSNLVKYKKFLKAPEQAIYKSILSTLTSSAFLSFSIGTSWSTICFFQHYLPSNFLPTKRFYLQGFLSGLWLNLLSIGTNSSSSNQQISDLGWYSVRLALPTFWQVAMKDKKSVLRKFRVRKNGEVIYFSFSMGILMLIWESYPELIKSGFVKRCLKIVAGESKFKKNVVDKEEKVVSKKD